MDSYAGGAEAIGSAGACLAAPATLRRLFIMKIPAPMAPITATAMIGPATDPDGSSIYQQQQN